MVQSSPHILYLLLGRQRALPSTLFWQSVLPRSIYVGVIDMAVHFLFGWTTRNISTPSKEVCYGHLYSFTSVKVIVVGFYSADVLADPAFRLCCVWM